MTNIENWADYGFAEMRSDRSEVDLSRSSGRKTINVCGDGRRRWQGYSFVRRSHATW